MEQASMYRWLNPDIITNDIMAVDYYFTDWNPNDAKVNKSGNYPNVRMKEKLLPMMSYEETEAYVEKKIMRLITLEDMPEASLPLCTHDELWQKPDKWEFWSKTTNKQCSKLCDTAAEAHEKNSHTNGLGKVALRQFQPTFCLWCDATDICSQAAAFKAKGLI
jgi:hypothetical protein